jgi:NAD(P)-dependent dehydrogenase (short-subunit alcohol dehydrogenase family)
MFGCNKKRKEDGRARMTHDNSEADRRFDGRAAIVTGAASGIGRATALRLANEGAHVIAADIDAAGGAVLARERDSIEFIATDVTREVDIVALVAHAGDRLDVMVNNAGAGGDRDPIDEISVEGWDATMNLLLRSVAIGTREAARAMRRSGHGGAIVNTASVAALQTGMAPTAYSVAKAGVLHLSKLAAADLARYNIRVNAVCPGFITTNIFTAALGIEGEARAQANAMIAGVARQSQPVARAGEASDIAAAIAYLASDDAAFVTGTHVLVDGGLTIGPRHSWDPQSPGLFDALTSHVPA